MNLIFTMSGLTVVREMFCVVFLDYFLKEYNTFLFQSPHITSSSSSSEGDEEEADGEVGGEPRGQQEELSSGKTNSPPPSYNHQQVLKHLIHFLCRVLTHTHYFKLCSRNSFKRNDNNHSFSHKERRTFWYVIEHHNFFWY